MRAEVVDALAAQRAAAAPADGGPAGAATAGAAAGFRFAALEGELAVAGVYVRVFNSQPNFALANPQDFCKVRPLNLCSFMQAPNTQGFINLFHINLRNSYPLSPISSR